MTYLTHAGVKHTDILDSCRSHIWRFFTPVGGHTWRYLSPAEVIHFDILDSFRSHTFKFLTPVGVLHCDIFDSCKSYIEILDSCRSHTY